MVPLTYESKQCYFGAAGKMAAAKTTVLKKLKFKLPKAGNPSGMLSAVGLDSSTPNKHISKSKSTPTSKKKTEAQLKRDAIYKEVNKYGLIALSATTLLNHGHNTIHKLVAAAQGDMNKFKFYEEKAKSYLKPHFSLPSQWHQPRITFGTPWYY